MQVAVELAHHLDDAGARFRLTTHHHRVGALVGHHLGGEQQGGGATLGVAILVEVGHQPHHFTRRGELELDDVHILIACAVDPVHHFHQAVDHGGAAGDQQHIGGLVVHHVATTGVVVELAQQRCKFTDRDVAHRHDPGYHLVAHARVAAIHHRNGGGLGIPRAQHLEHPVVHRYHGKAVDVEHAQEELVVLLLIEQVVAAHVDLAAHRWLYDDGFIEVLAHRIDELFNLGVLETGRVFGGPG